MSEEKIKIPEKFKDIVSTIENMTVRELAELVKVMEEIFGVSAAAAASHIASQEQVEGEEGGEAELKTTVSIELKSAGSQKIQVIKVLREVTGLGLKEAKDITDVAPKVIKEGVARAEAEEIKKKLEEAGAVVELK